MVESTQSTKGLNRTEVLIKRRSSPLYSMSLTESSETSVMYSGIEVYRPALLVLNSADTGFIEDYIGLPLC